MAESIFTEEPIEFFSHRMKSAYAVPNFKMSMTINPDMKKGKDAREVLNIEGTEMVVPNTYESDKWNDTSEKAIKAKLLAEAKLAKLKKEK